MDTRDAFRAAHLIMQQHGDDAVAHSMRRALELKLAGDGAGEQAWVAISAAIIQLRTDTPGADGLLH